jgi:hypothetical protein
VCVGIEGNGAIYDVVIPKNGVKMACVKKGLRYYGTRQFS